MSRARAAVAAAFAVALGVLPLGAQQTERRVSVVPLASSLGVLESEARALTALFESALVRSGAFAVVKQDEMAAVLAAQEASLADYADRDGAVELGRVLSASHIVVGSVARLGRSWVASLQLVEVRTARAVHAESGEVLAPEAFPAMAASLAGGFAAAGGLEPRPAAPPTPRTALTEAERVRTYLAIGDRFLELRRWDAAIAQYAKARALAEFDVDVLWRTLTAMERRLLASTLYSADALATGLDVALRDDIASFRLAPRDQVDAALEVLYAMQAIDPLLADDVTLLLDEARLAVIDSRLDDAREALRRARRIEPEDPTVMAELGLLESLAKDASRVANGVALLRAAVAASPETPRFRLYLGRALERSAEGPSGEALRSYRAAARLASAPDFWTQRIRRFAEQSMIRAYFAVGALPGGVLTASIDLPVAERLEQVSYLVEAGAAFSSRTSTQNPELYLASLALASGDAGRAERVARAALPADPARWTAAQLPLLNVLAQALVQSGADAALLGRVRARVAELGR